ncbi:MAG: methionine biosynthesis protein MetW [Armatimonadota bacterium]|nr:methionine biosynthesis protein MetW [Armatimonadota bacterium]
MNARTDEDIKGNPALDENGLAPELRYIVDLVDEGAQVLDLGCGSGNLLKVLQAEKRVRAQGIDLSDECIQVCVSKGLFVFHGDLDEGLADFNDQSMDYVISVDTLQALHKPDDLLREMGRVGKNMIVSIPNFGYWAVRAQLFFRGRMPKNPRLPYEWYNTPNIHHTTLNDFRDLCTFVGLEILREIPLRTRSDGSVARVHLFPNLLADYIIFLMRHKPEHF